MQNSGKTIFKRTSVDHLMNILVLCVRPPALEQRPWFKAGVKVTGNISRLRQIFGLLASLCAIMTIGNYIWEEKEGTAFTAFFPREPGTSLSLSVFLSFWSYVIVLNTLVPISLYVR